MSTDRVEVAHEVDGVTIRARVAPELEASAQTVLTVMAKDGLKDDPESGEVVVDSAIERLQAGTPMWWGFSAATPRPIDGGYELVTPNFLAELPDGTGAPESTDDLTPMLDIRDKMQRVSLAVRDEGEATRCDDRVILAGGWRDHRTLVLIRDEPRPGDSGWFVVPQEAPDWKEEELESLPAWRLLRERPELVWPMSLPAGWIAWADPGKLVKVFDRDDRVLAEDLEL